MPTISGHRQAELLARSPARLLTEVTQFGPTLVVAPHPDDESLGAGGAVALLRHANVPVHVLFISDGSQSHPNSPAYPAQRLTELREAEAREALHILNVSSEAATFMRLPDTRVPLPGDADFAPAVQSVVSVLNAFRPATVLVPWRRDPHRDHRAAWHLLREAVRELAVQPRWLEYPIWLWELGGADDQPLPGEVWVLQLPIGPVISRKKEAIAAHRSQVTRLIDDDPTAFSLSPNLLAHFDVPHELFFEPI